MNRAALKRSHILAAVEQANDQGRLAEMAVAEVMTREPTCVLPHTAAMELVALFQKNGFRHLLVAQERQLVGVISDRDVIRLMGQTDFQQRSQWDEFAAQDLMCDRPHTVAPETPLVAAVRLIAENGLSCLPVVQDGQVVGILTATDLYLALEQILLIGAGQLA